MLCPAQSLISNGMGIPLDLVFFFLTGLVYLYKLNQSLNGLIVNTS